MALPNDPLSNNFRPRGCARMWNFVDERTLLHTYRSKCVTPLPLPLPAGAPSPTQGH